MEQHHILAEVLVHVTSPLTSALIIFGTYKASHLPKMAALFRANRILLKSKLRAPAPSAAHAPRVAETVSSSMSVARAEQSASAVRAASVASSRPGGSDDSPLTSVATASPLSKRGYALAARPLPPRRAMSSPLGAFGARPSGLQHGRQLSSAVGALVDAAMVTSPITGHVVPWSVAQFETLINYAHTQHNMSWWSSLVSVTLMFRVAVLPLNVSLVRNTARLYLARADLKKQDAVMLSETASEEEKMDAALAYKATLRENKCHPLKNLVSPFLFPPIFLSLFGAVIDISTSGLPGVSTGGALWFPDLSQPDPTKLLPVLSGITWLATIELASGKVFRMPPWMLSATRLGAVAFIPVTESLPAGVFMFWITSNLFAMTRAYALRQKPVATFFRVPEVTRSPDTP